jgi:c-di-GMP-binding flagellar brake protein YcgR
MPTPHDDRRRHPRARVPSLASHYGEVVDLSAGGMKVFHKGAAKFAVGDTFDATLDHPTGSARVSAEVVWIEDVGLRRRLVGCRFIDPPSDTTAALERLVHAGQPEAKGPAVYLD